MSYTTPITWTSGQKPTAAQFNANIRDNVSFLANPPACRVYNSGNISITNGVGTALTFNSERYDTDSMHDTVTNNGRITFNTAGLYAITFTGVYASNFGGTYRGFYIDLNSGVDPIAFELRPPVNGQPTRITLATVYKFAVSDHIRIMCDQDSGGALNVLAVGKYSPEFSATWIGLG